MQSSYLESKYAYLAEDDVGGSSQMIGDIVDQRRSNLDQIAVLDNDSSDMTSLLTFHPTENALVVVDDADRISLWNYDEGRKSKQFHCGNGPNSRMTSVSFINVTGNSLLMTGCDDGTVRVFNGVIDEGIGSIVSEGYSEGISEGYKEGQNKNKGVGVTLAQGFFGAPDMVSSARGSGLVLEYQESSRHLLASGTVGRIRQWNLETNQLLSNIETGTEACVTSITTPWEEGVADHGPPSSTSFFSPSCVVAGFGDGCLRLFDLRANLTSLSLHEHSSWVVGTSMIKSRGELVSSSVGGDLKFWDLRAASSLRTFDVQRSPMTAFSSHPSLPLLATGSHAQFIKILSLTGVMVTVIRYHEGFLGQRIGPVSCLAFHPVKCLLAAGATDSIVALYGSSDS